MPCRAGTGRYWQYCCGSSQPRAGAAHPPSGAAALRRIGHGRADGSSGPPCTGGAPRSDWAAPQAPRRRCGPRRHAARWIACRPRRLRPGPGPGPVLALSIICPRRRPLRRVIALRKTCPSESRSASSTRLQVSDCVLDLAVAEQIWSARGSPVALWIAEAFLREASGRSLHLASD